MVIPNLVSLQHQIEYRNLMALSLKKNKDLKLKVSQKPTQVIGSQCEKAGNVTFVQEQKMSLMMDETFVHLK